MKRKTGEATEPQPADADTASRMGEDLDFMQRLWAVDQGLHSMSKRMRRQLGVTGPQRLVVRIVGKFPGISAGRVAEVLRVHPSTLTGVLQRLERHGLIARTADPKDGRRALFRLTEHGRKVDGFYAGTVEGAVRRALCHVPPERITATQQVLALVATELRRETPQER